MKENKPQSTSENNPSFQKKVWIVVGILAFSIITLLLLKATFRVFLLILAGALIAIFFRGLSNFIQKKTKWKEGICVAISIISTFLIVIGLFWLIGAKVQDQMAELVETLPKTVENAKVKLNESSIGRNIVDNFSSVDSIEKAQGFAGQFFQSTFGFFGDLYVVLFIGIFFTISPKTYINGLIQLIPIKGQEAGKQVLNNISNQLLNWLKGTFFAMFVVFVLTAIGLAIIGIPLWLVLALLAGLISFIPNFGPLIALIPAVLIGLLQSPETALLVVGLYMLIQFIESNFITTSVQKKLLNLPPALIIIAQLIMGTLTGIWGLVLATPIIVILIVLVQDLYIKNRE